MSVLLLPPIFQFFDNNGDPLANGFVYTYAAGTTAPKTTYTSSAGTVAAPNPIELDSAGRPSSGGGAIWGEGAYKFIVQNSSNVQVGDVLDNVTSFTTLAASTNAYFESFSGNGVQTVFTTSSSLGTEEKGLMVFVNNGLQEIAVNGSFATDTSWTKGAGWTIGSGVATATGAISTALSQVPVVSLIVGQAYAVTYTITRSAGGLIPSLGGQNGTERTASGTYREIIIAAATTPISFTGNGFTGTLDNVSITRADASGYDIQAPSAFTINGTSLTFATAPASGTNNIYVFAPSLLLGAASAAASLAETYAANALVSQNASAANAASAAAFGKANIKWTYSSTTTMADPSTGNVRFNNATVGSATAMAISDLSADSGNPDLSAWISTWDDGSGSNRGTLYVFNDNGNFALFTVNTANVDNTTWNQVSLTPISSSGTISNGNNLYLGFAAAGTTTVTGGITALVGDVTASGAGSVTATIANNAVTTAKILNNNVTLAKLATQPTQTVLMNATAGTAVPTAVALTASQLLGVGSTGNGGGITLGTNLSMSGTTLNAATPSGFPAAVTGTLSGASTTFTVDFTTYSAYMLLVQGAIAGSSDLTIDVSTDGGGTYATATRMGKRITGVSITNQNSNEGVVGASASTIRADFVQPTTTSASAMNYISDDASTIIQNGIVRFATSAAINRIRLTCGGTFTAGRAVLQPISLR